VTRSAGMHGVKLRRLLKRVYYVLSVPVSIVFLLDSTAIHAAYRMYWFRRLALGLRMFVNTIRIPTATSYKAHLAMALKILETPPEVHGDIIECGTYKGGSAANLSLVCRVTGRKLKVCDSFEGLPEGDARDREAKHYSRGDYAGMLEEVQRNIRRAGAPECCEFIPGWFRDTLPSLSSPVLLAFVDVDLEASLETCIRYIWPNLVKGGFIFIDEAVSTDYSALFYSERWWRESFGCTPPGLIGAGTGLGLGGYYVGPWDERHSHLLQHAGTAAYTRKGMSGHWSYYPDDQ